MNLRSAALGCAFLVVALVSFGAGRSCERDTPKIVPIERVDSATFHEEFIDPPSGPRLSPVRAVVAPMPGVRLAGCVQPPPPRTAPDSTSPPPEDSIPEPPRSEGIESLLSIELRAGRAHVSRYTANSEAVMTEYRLPERGNRFSVTANESGSLPTVVGDRFWYLRDVELVAIATPNGLYLGGKVPLTNVVSLLGGAGSGPWGGASIRPFVSFP